MDIDHQEEKLDLEKADSPVLNDRDQEESEESNNEALVETPFIGKPKSEKKKLSKKSIIIISCVSIIAIIVLIIGLVLGLREKTYTIPEVIKKMTLEEKADMVTGLGYWEVKGVERLNVPKIMMTDGPHGLRKKDPNATSGHSYPATCFPTAVTTSCSWDPDLINEMGVALAEECLKQNVSVILGPGVNIKRSPTCGRNFEYFSEDPLLSGEIAASYIKGVQSKGIGVSLKHFAVNSQEKLRMVINEVVDERALREMYLTAFEIAVKKGNPWTVMTAYNKVNGTQCSENKLLQEDILRKEWGFDGLIVTDWGASADRIEGLKAGTDLEMPSSGDYNTKKIIDAIKNKILDENTLNKNIEKILNLIYKSKDIIKKGCPSCPSDHHELARKIAANSMVLLKNEEKILPLQKGKKIAIIGELAKSPRYQGAGSSGVNPIKIDNAYDFLIANNNYEVSYAQGYKKTENKININLINEAKEVASKADIAVVFIGLTEDYEAEGYDRTNLDLPSSHNKLIDAITEVSTNVVVVLAGGSPVLMPWLGKVKGLLHSLLGGEATGSAVVDILTGLVNPSGKLAETYPMAYEDNPTYGFYPGDPVISEHKESIYLGYRYYDTANLNVLFPFGYGLSYTTFEYSDFSFKQEAEDSTNITVSFKIKNTGSVYGAETAQLYISPQNSTIYRPYKELKGFKKVKLEPGASEEIIISLNKRSFAYYNVNIKDWHVEEGNYNILIGSSSKTEDMKKIQTFYISSSNKKAIIPDYHITAPSYYTASIHNISDQEWEKVLGYPIPSRERDNTKKLTIYNNIGDAYTEPGIQVQNLIKLIMNIFVKDKMISAMALELPLRNFISMTMNIVDEETINGLLMILNNEDVDAGWKIVFEGIKRALPRLKELFDAI